MSDSLPHRAAADRLMVIEWDGATLDVLAPLAQTGIMPTLGRLLNHSALWRLRWRGLGSPTAAWTTLRSGCGPEQHGVWDESRLEPRRSWILPVDEAAVPCPALPELLSAAPRAACLAIHDRPDAAGIWVDKPGGFEDLRTAAARTERLLTTLADRARQATTGTWRLLEIRFQSLALLQHRLWHLLEPNASGGSPSWIAAAHDVFRAWDRTLEHLLELAERQGAAVALCSPYGFVPFREKVTLVELLRQRGLLELASGVSKVAYRAQRILWHSVRRVATGSRKTTLQGVSAPVAGLLPIDWRRSRAVTLHGQHAALVYLNTPERFGTRVLTTSAARDAALTDTLATLREVRHPVTREPLFVEVFSTATNNDDAIKDGEPDVVAIPAAGFLTRQRPDHRRHLLRSDRSLAGIQGSDGMLLLRAPGIEPGERGTVALTDAAPLLLGVLTAHRSVPSPCDSLSGS